MTSPPHLGRITRLLLCFLLAAGFAHAQIQTHTTTNLSTSAARFAYGSPVTLTIALSPASAAGPVTLTDNAQPLASLTLANGTAAFTSTTFAPGLHTFVATYAGDLADAASASPVLLITIDPDTPTLTLSAEPSSAPWLTLPPLTVTLHPASATGTLTLTDANRSTPPAIAAIAGSSATFELANLSPGLHTLTATYSGDANDRPAVSSPISVTVTPASAAVALQITPSSSTWSQSVTLAAHASPATGSVTFSDSLNGPLGQSPINSSGLATLVTSALSVGLHTLTAALAADPFHNAATTSQPLLVAPGPTITTLNPLLPGIPTGSPVTLTATVVPSSATGLISFRDTAVGLLGQASLTPDGTATLTVSSLNPGLHTLTAAFPGSLNLAPSTSAAISTSVTPETTALTLALSPADPVAFQPVTLTVLAQPASVTGLLTFTDGPRTVGQTLLQNGSAILTTATLTAAPHTLLATLAADSTHAAATSSSHPLSIAQDPTTLTLTPAQNPLSADLPITINLHLAAPYGVPTGTLSLLAGASPLASTTVPQSGAVTLTLPGSLSPGTYPLTAAYSGDPNNLPADTSANPVLLTITPIPTTGRLSLSASSAFPDTAITLTATLTTASPTTLIPIGTLQFRRDGVLIASAPLTPQGTASTTIPSLPLGTSTFVAQFQPASPFAPATLGPASLNVAQPFALTLNPAALTITPTALQPYTETSTLTLTPLAGFTGPVTLACASPEAFLSCTLSPSTAALLSTSADATLTLTAYPTSLAQTRNRTDAPQTPILALAALVLLLPLRRLRRLIPGVILASLCLTLSSCGWGGSLDLIPSGVYSVVVTASGGGIILPGTLSVTILPPH